MSETCQYSWTVLGVQKASRGSFFSPELCSTPAGLETLPVDKSPIVSGSQSPAMTSAVNKVLISQGKLAPDHHKFIQFPTSSGQIQLLPTPSHDARSCATYGARRLDASSLVQRRNRRAIAERLCRDAQLSYPSYIFSPIHCVSIGHCPGCRPAVLGLEAKMCSGKSRHSAPVNISLIAKTVARVLDA